MDQFNQLDSLLSPSPSPPPTPPPPPPPPGNTHDLPIPLAPPPLAIYPSREALFEAIQAWAKPRGYAFITSKSKKIEDGRYKVYYACDRRPPIRPNIVPKVRHTQSRGSGCQFSIASVELPLGSGWEVRYRPIAEYNTHNHPPSESPATHSSHRHLLIKAQNTARRLYSAGK
jgi:hypothetical protein